MTIFGSSNWTVAVHRLAARAQLVHDDSRGCSTGCRTSSIASGPTRPAHRRPSRSCRCRPTAGLQPAGERRHRRRHQRRRAVVERRPVGAHLRHLLRHHAESAAARANKSSARASSSTDYRTYALPALHAGHDLLLEDRLEDDGVRRPQPGPVWSFTTAGSAPAQCAPTVSLTSPAGGATFSRARAVTLTATARRQRRLDRARRFLCRDVADRQRRRPRPTASPGRTSRPASIP